MKEKLTKQEVAEAKREARSFAQMKKKFKKAIIQDDSKLHDYHDTLTQDETRYNNKHINN